MDSKFDLQRRRFLRTLLASGAAATMLPHMNLVGQALAGTPAQGGYRALVCVFLLGGNDSFNLLIPHSQAEYNIYEASRGGIYNASSNSRGLGIARDELLPLLDMSGKTWGLHPACPELKAIHDAGNLAFLANVGSLLAPVTKLDAQRNKKLLPNELYSHSDQQRQWNIGHSVGTSASFGWGGRCADQLRAANANGYTPLPPGISLSGNNLFQTGTTTTPYAVSAVGPSNPILFGTSDLGERARREALMEIVQRRRGNVFQDQYAMLGESALVLGEKLGNVLSPANGGDIATVFPEGNSLADQLRMVARLIKAGRGPEINHQRQIYYVGMGGFDTHDGQGGVTGRHATLLRTLSSALGAFHNALQEIGALQDVVTFTTSEFGRTLNGNGNGTDHGWGGVQLVMSGGSRNGGSLQERVVHGNYPLLELDGNQSMGRGRMIPTTSVSQMGATMAKWMGVNDADLPFIFPGLTNFDRRTLDFLG